MGGHGMSSEQPSAAPRYREAYPYLDIGKANAAFRRGDYICEFTDRSGGRAGVARFDLRGDRCQLEYHIYTPFIGLVSDWAGFELTPIVNGFERRRLTITCPGCRKRRKILFLKEKWSCADCHELLYRCQLINPLAKEWEKFDRLSKRLRSGKPHGIRNVVYKMLLEELEDVESRLNDQSRRYASSTYSHAVNATWRAPLPRDGAFLFSLIADAESDTPDRLDGANPQPLLGPHLSEPRSGLVFGADFETDDPDEI